MNENTFVDTFFFRLSIFWFHFFFCPHFCRLCHFKTIRCIAKSLITTSTYFLLKYNWKTKTWKVFFGRQSLGIQTDLPNSLDTLLTFLKIVWMFILFLHFLTIKSFMTHGSPAVVTTFGHKRIGTQRIKDKRWNKSWDLRDLLSQAKKATQKIAFLYITI